jgi:hypothetical protein
LPIRGRPSRGGDSIANTRRSPLDANAQQSRA